MRTLLIALLLAAAGPACGGDDDQVVDAGSGADAAAADAASVPDDASPPDAIPAPVTLTVSRTGLGAVTSTPAGIDCGTTCAADFPYGASVTLTASPSVGGIFTGWSGGLCSGTAPCVVTATMATTVTATFTDVWSKRCGDAVAQQANDLTTDAAGNVIVAGTFAGTLDCGSGPVTSAGLEDIFVAKFDAGGAPLWLKRFGSATTDTVHGVATDAAGNIVLVGAFSGTIDLGGGALTSAGGNDILLAKLDPAGVHLWSKRFGDAGVQVGIAVAVDSLGNVLLTGSLAGATDFGGGALTSAGGTDAFVAKFDSGGAFVWSQLYGNASSQSGEGLAVDAAGNVIVAGTFAGTINLGGVALTSAGGTDAFVAKLSSSGSHVWSKRFGTADAETALDVAVDAGGNVALTGALGASGVDFGGGAVTGSGWVGEFDPTGAHLFSRAIAPGNEVAFDATGQLVVAGNLTGTVDFGAGPLTSAGGSDIFVAVYAVGGAIVSSRHYGDAAAQEARGVAVDTSGAILIAGAMAGTTDFGGGALLSAGGDDVFVARLLPL